jgi:hypothetical protein
MSLDFLGGPATREFEPRGWLGRFATVVLVYGILVSTGGFFVFRVLVCLILKLSWPSLQIVGAGQPCPACQMVTPPQQSQSDLLIGSCWVSEGNVAVKTIPNCGVVCHG